MVNNHGQHVPPKVADLSFKKAALCLHFRAERLACEKPTQRWIGAISLERKQHLARQARHRGFYTTAELIPVELMAILLAKECQT